MGEVFFFQTILPLQPGGPKNPKIIESLGIQSYSQMMIRVSNHLLSKVFRFHYHSQKVIGSLGIIKVGERPNFQSEPPNKDWLVVESPI